MTLIFKDIDPVREFMKGSLIFRNQTNVLLYNHIFHKSSFKSNSNYFNFFFYLYT